MRLCPSFRLLDQAFSSIPTYGDEEMAKLLGLRAGNANQERVVREREGDEGGVYVDYPVLLAAA
jgi:hypothetical protein